MAEEDKATGEKSGDWVEDISDTVAPSVGPHSTLVHHAREETKASDLDAMGQDKRRQVVGQGYGPSLARQGVLYLAFVVIIVAIGFGVSLLVDKYDQPPKHFPAEAPWAQPGVKQIPPKPLQ
jgi:hypothetical protein